jgi:hypothetical protein
VAAEGTVGTERHPPPDLAVETVPLRIGHHDVAGERVEQVDVALRVVDRLPIELAGLDNVETPAGCDL